MSTSKKLKAVYNPFNPTELIAIVMREPEPEIPVFDWDDEEGIAHAKACRIPYMVKCDMSKYNPFGHI